MNAIGIIIGEDEIDHDDFVFEQSRNGVRVTHPATGQSFHTHAVYYKSLQYVLAQRILGKGTS